MVIQFICSESGLTEGSLNMGLPRDGKNSAQNVGDPSSTPGSGRSPGGENGNPREYSCLGNPMVRGAGGWGRGGGYGPWGCEESDVTNMLMLVTAFIAGCFARCSQMCNELELFFP